MYFANSSLEFSVQGVDSGCKRGVGCGHGPRRSGKIATESVEILAVVAVESGRVEEFQPGCGSGDAANVKEIGDCGDCRSGNRK